MPANFNLLLLDIAWYYNKFSSELHKVKRECRNQVPDEWKESQTPNLQDFRIV